MGDSGQGDRGDGHHAALANAIAAGVDRPRRSPAHGPGHRRERVRVAHLRVKTVRATANGTTSVALSGARRPGRPTARLWSVRGLITPGSYPNEDPAVVACLRRTCRLVDQRGREFSERGRSGLLVDAAEPVSIVIGAASGSAACDS